MKNITVNDLKVALKARSAWDKGVLLYAEELLENLTDENTPIEKQLLNGAFNWKEYSFGGCSLIFDEDIARRLCTATELKRSQNGRKTPNKVEQWLDTQARALSQAAQLIKQVANSH